MPGPASSTVADLAERLWRAEYERVAVEPLTTLRPGLTVEDAYAVRTRNIGRRVAAGAVVRGRKVGPTASVLLPARGTVTAEFDGLGSVGVHCT